MTPLQQTVLQSAAQAIVEEGQDWHLALAKAAKDQGLRDRHRWPSMADLEEAVMEHIAIFCPDEQAQALRELRELAVTWLQKLAGLQPYVAGAVWRGSATWLSPLQIDLYPEDPKAAVLLLINAGIPYDSADPLPGRHAPLEVLVCWSRPQRGGESIPVHLYVHEPHALRGALLPDRKGRTWRGDLPALLRLLNEPGSPTPTDSGHL